MNKFAIYIRERRKASISKKVCELLPEFQREYDSSNVEKDLEFIRKLKSAINDKSELVLDAGDEATLKRLADLICKK